MPELNEIAVRFESRLEAVLARFETIRVDVGQLQQNHAVLKQEIGTISGQIEALSTKLDESRKTNLPFLISMAAFLPIIAGFSVWLLSAYTNSSISPIKSEIAAIASTVANNSNSVHGLEEKVITSMQADANSRTDRDQLNNRVRMLEQNLAGEIANRRSDSSEFKVHLTEIETQFQSANNQTNINLANQGRVNSMIWKKVYGEPYPEIIFYPPSIFQMGGNSNLGKDGHQ